MEVSERCIQLTRYFYPATERPDATLCNQLQQASELLSIMVTRPLLPFQIEALTCLISDLLAGYVASPTRFPDSMLLKAINRGQFQIAAAEFYTFCLVKDKVDSRAWEKRKFEQHLFSRGILIFA